MGLSMQKYVYVSPSYETNDDTNHIVHLRSIRIISLYAEHCRLNLVSVNFRLADPDIVCEDKLLNVGIILSQAST